MPISFHRKIFRYSLNLTLSIGLCGCAEMVESVKDTTAEMVRSDAGRALVCGGGAAATGGIFYLGCSALTGSGKECKQRKNSHDRGEKREQAKKDCTKQEENRKICTSLAVAVALADAFYCWWRISEKIIDDYADTRKNLNYDPSQGKVVKILEFNAMPKIVQPGEEVRIRAKYAIMSPSVYDEIKYEQKVTLPGDAKPRTTILTRHPGTWGVSDDYSVKIDPDAPEGKIVMDFEINLLDGNKRDRKNLCFYITKQKKPGTVTNCGISYNKPEANTLRTKGANKERRTKNPGQE